MICILLLSAAAASAEEGNTVTLWIATDLHYLSPSLHDDGALFRQILSSGDGKMTECMDEAVDAWVAQAIQARPDAVILGGDVTVNGELRSLQDLCGKLRRLTDTGIPVLMIPGNHDINYPYARRYEMTIASQTEAISGAAFRELCGPFGLDRAMSRDESSCSYVYALSDRLRILTLDANTEELPGSLTDRTLVWAKEQLRQAAADGARVITVTHQNVLKQDTLLFNGFVLGNHEAVAELLRNNGVSLNLSGHSHLQHTSEENGLTDICTGAFAVAPIRYAVLEAADDGSWHYETRPVGVYEEEAWERLRSTTRRQVESTLGQLALTEEERAEMLRFAVEINTAFYSGTLTEDMRQKALESRGWALWREKAAPAFWIGYLDHILSKNE